MVRIINKNLADSQVPEQLLFAAHCRAKAVGHITGYAECQSESPNGCSYRQPFGFTYLCHHPQHQKIVARTSQTPHQATREPEPDIES
jgi:hypothetical protein